jgi:hypothetical protein
MILNGLTQFSLASAALRLVLCGVMIGVAVSAVRKGTKSDCDSGAAVLVTMLALLIGSLALLSWPMYFATLQSYVEQWPGTMCIYGVLQVGGGSGDARWMPLVAEAVIWIKPLLALSLGAWCVAHLLNRTTHEGQLERTVVTLVLTLGLFGGIDAALEGGYLLTPKRNASPAPGCCVVQFSTAHSEPGSWSARLQPIDPKLASTLFFISTIGLAVGLWITAGLRSPGRNLSPNLLTALGLLVAPLGWVFFSRTVTPAVLNDARSFCLYDLIPLSPQADAGGALLILGLILLLCGRFALYLTPRAEHDAPAHSLCRGLFRSASICLFISVMLLALCLT